MESKTPSSSAPVGAIQAVIFDLDGVLMDSEYLAFKAWREIVASHGGELKESVYPGMVGLTQEKTARYVMEHTGITFDIDAGSEHVWRRMDEMLAEQIEPQPGAVELVQLLQERGYPLAIASNGITDYVHNALNGLKLSKYFPIVVGIDQVQDGKPAPDVYLRAAQQLGADPSRCLAVEDSLVGVQAAKAAGMRVIAVPDHHRNGEGDFSAAWRIYSSLVEVGENLDDVLK